MTETAGSERVRWSELVRFVLSWAARRRPHQDQAELSALVEAEVKNRTLPQEVLPMSQQVFQTNEDWLLEQGALRENRKSLRTLLEARFAQLPPELVQRIETQDDLERLRHPFQYV